VGGSQKHAEVTVGFKLGRRRLVSPGTSNFDVMWRLYDDSQLTATLSYRLPNELLQSPSKCRSVDLRLSVDELDGSSYGARSEDLRMLRGRRIVRVQYLRW
jgi:hypothetical protein